VSRSLWQKILFVLLNLALIQVRASCPISLVLDQGFYSTESQRQYPLNRSLGMSVRKDKSRCLCGGPLRRFKKLKMSHLS
jgi:hypothetical protein